jgi:L-asparaginase II
MNFSPMIELTRNGISECLHMGALAVTDTEGRVLAQVGNPHWLCFTRSALKALQALPLIQSGGAQQLGLTSKELALMCASHNGEDMHLEQVSSILQKSGNTYQQLRCGCHVPYRFSFNDKPLPEGFAVDERHHNCSGKHSGFLAYCSLHGVSKETYTELDHPLQLQVRKAVADVTGVASENLRWGIDGCSAPNFAVPLSALARSYARLAKPEVDNAYGASLKLLGEAMTAHPELVSGTGRSDADFMRVGRGDWVTKVGADGVQVIGSRSRGQALALKIADGNKVALFAATVEALDQLGWLDDVQRQELQAWRAQSLKNIKGLEVGERRGIFKIQSV